MLKKIDHIGIAVFNLDEASIKCEKLYQIKPKRIEVLEALSLRIAFIPVGEVMLELLEPLVPGKGRVGEFLKEHGEGLQHIAYRVHNLESVLEKLRMQGVELRDEKPRPGGGGSRVAFLSPRETNNVLTELVERQVDL